MRKLILPVLSVLTAVAVVGILMYASSQGVAVLEPQGFISSHQRDLFYLAVALGLVALIPVFVMTYMIIHRYHEGNAKSERRFNRKWEIKPEASWIWGVFVTLVITVLAVVMIKSTHAIDPYKPLPVESEPMTVRVVALSWKWLFFYPEERIATVNELAIPVGTPVEFELIADAPMSSFWIPKLGGMIYAMEGMVTRINLMATEPGEFQGVNTEINGKGYSGMKFKTKALPEVEYDQWVAEVRKSGETLDLDRYNRLAEPTIDHPVEHFAYADQQLFGHILHKFMDYSLTDSDDHANSTHHGVH